MSLETVALQGMPEEADSAPHGHALPDWLASLIDPAVWSAREAVVMERLDSTTGDIGLRYECARVMAQYYERMIHED